MNEIPHGLKNVREFGSKVFPHNNERLFWAEYTKNERIALREYSEALVRFAGTKYSVKDLKSAEATLPHLVLLASNEFNSDTNIKQLRYSHVRNEAHKILSTALMNTLFIDDRGNYSEYYRKHYMHNGTQLNPRAYFPITFRFSKTLDIMNRMNEEAGFVDDVSDPEHINSYVLQSFTENFGDDSFFRLPYSLEVYSNTVVIALDAGAFHAQYWLGEGVTFIRQDIYDKFHNGLEYQTYN